MSFFSHYDFAKEYLTMKRNLLGLLSVSLLIASCLPSPVTAPAVAPLNVTQVVPATQTSTQPNAPTPTPVPDVLVPNFQHIVIVIFENKEFGSVIGSPKMPYFNILVSSYTLLTEHYATTHPSLPNYISLIGGDTFDINSDCEDCFIDAPSLPDLIEKSGRTWKTYQEFMPEPCYLGSTLRYVQKHNPFIYFNPIRLDAERCAQSIVPLTQLYVDIASKSLPNFIFITPDICHSAHDCGLDQADIWLKTMMDTLVVALGATNEPYLIILTWDEGQGTHSCCGLSEEAGGRVATVLISPQVKTGFQDDTPYSHYSVLKTIAEAWGLPYLGHAADAETTLITAPWK
jgi:phospholipase C